MLKKIFTVRKILSFLLLFSLIYAGYSIYYKIKYWGFNFAPRKMTDVWTIEAHIAFEPTGEPIKVSLRFLRKPKNLKFWKKISLPPAIK